MKSQCTVSDCSNPSRARGWCKTHYRRWQRTGTTDHSRPDLLDIPGYAESRFWTHVNKTAACWLWTGLINIGGYGSVRWRGRVGGAHIVSYQLLVGELPEGTELDHLCRVRHCVNPAHLEPVSHAVNMSRGSWALKTHCPQGHEYTGRNVMHIPSRPTARYCRECHRIASHEVYMRTNRAHKR